MLGIRLIAFCKPKYGFMTTTKLLCAIQAVTKGPYNTITQHQWCWQTNTVVVKYTVNEVV